MKSPKQQFLENTEDVRFLSDLTEKAAFQRAITFALLQLVHESTNGTPCTSSEEAARRYSNMQGAEDLIRILNSLWQMPKPSVRADTGNLIHK